MRFISWVLINLLVGFVIVSGQGTRNLEREKAALLNTDARTALVIGNGKYADSPLRNPPNDAGDMAAALRSLGFEVLSHINLDQNAMKRAVDEFGAKLRVKGGVGLFYYAGHGVQVKGVNYLIPIGARVDTEEAVEYESVEAGRVLAQMESARNPVNIVILDACRNNPFARAFRSADRGLAPIQAPSGTLLAYATAPGSVALDGTARNGLYTQELLKNIQAPGVGIEDVFKQVRVSVRRATSDKQTPWEVSSLTGDFFFSGTSTGKAPQTNRVSAPPPITSNQPPATRPDVGTSSPNASAIATKDIGSLRVVLKSIMRVLNLKDRGGSSVNGIRCSFEFINLETQAPIVVALNATQASNSGQIMGTYLRSTLVDENGRRWLVSTSDAAGMSVVSVVYKAPMTMYDPSEIASVLARRDDLNSDTDEFVRGDPYNRRYYIIRGSTTEMLQGRSQMVTMTFVPEGHQTNSDTPPKVVEIATEIVVGMVKTGTKTSYALHNFTFDQVNLSAPGK